MAKVGEGDNRWIVKQRDDGRNCNSWHWEEQNLTEFSKQRLTEMLVGVAAFEDSSGFCKITKLDSCKGEVTAQQRKGKKFVLYELEIILNWEGQYWDGDGKVLCEAKGKLKCPDLSEETIDELASEMSVTCDDDGGKKAQLKEAMRKKGISEVEKVLLEFTKNLKQMVQAGGAAEPNPKEAAAATEKKKTRANDTYVVSNASNSKQGEVKVNYNWQAPPSRIYEALLDVNVIRAATASDASLTKEVGGKFVMFNGAIEGEYVELVPNEKIVQKWRFNTWQPGHYSTVTMTFTDKDGDTKLALVQTGVPQDETERTEGGWTNLLFDRMKGVLGLSVHY